LLLRNSLQDLLERFEPSKHNGAPSPGFRRVVVKGYGKSDRNALFHAIKEAVVEVDRQVPRLIESMINDYSIEGDL
jgi:glycerol-3-phosphate acyltransferase PlsX